MNFKQYQAIHAINWSTLKNMRVSPRHYLHGKEHQIGDGRPLRLGRALHTMILEPDEACARHPVWPGKSRYGKAWDEFVAEFPDTDPLLQSEYDDACAMYDAIQRCTIAQEHLSKAVSEKTLVWDDPETGLKCKARADSVNGHLVELKSCNTRDFPPERFEAHAIRMGYHGQVAHYQAGLEASGYEVDHGPAMIVVESEAPYDVIVYVLKEEFTSAGKGLRAKLLRRVAECKLRNRWPGVMNDGEIHLGIPPWAEWEAVDDGAPVVTFGGHDIGSALAKATASPLLDPERGSDAFAVGDGHRSVFDRLRQWIKGGKS